MQEQGNVSSSALPEGCIANILSFTSPRDACCSALVSSMFKSAADSNLVWEKFLPSDYQDLLSKTSINFTEVSTKKELYLRLCGDPILLEGGNKSVNLEKMTGKKCIALGARELTFTWGDTPRYWTWASHSNSRFAETAELSLVWWLEIEGKVNTQMLSPQTTYVAYLLIKNAHGALGLHYPPAEATVGFTEKAGTASVVRKIYLSRETTNMFGTTRRPEFSEDLLPRKRKDGWMEIEIGEFYNNQGDDGEVQMNIQEVKGGQAKSGLIIEGIELRPKANSF